MSFAAEVWKTLSQLNVSEHTEKKGNLTYLSWTWAWSTLMDYYPESSYAFREPVDRPDGSCEVWVDVTITDGEKSVTRSMWLPVMGNKGEALKHPDARKLNDTRMRCLTKAIAMFGLGNYIYAGEDLPQSDLDEVRRGYTKEQKAEFGDIFEAEDALAMWVFRKTVGDEVYSSLNGSFVDKKMECKRRVSAMEHAANEQLESLAQEFIACIDNGDEMGLAEFVDYEKPIKAYLFNRLTPEQKHNLDQIKKAA
jgi:hypothetical protein